LLRDPIVIDLHEGLASTLALGCLERSDQDTIGGKEILDGSTLGQKLRIGQDVEATAWFRVGLKNGAHGLGCATWDGGFLNNNLGRGGNARDLTCRELDITAEGFYIRRDIRCKRKKHT
jgi:hypothetical protein